MSAAVDIGPRGPEHQAVRLPIIARLVELGWSEDQLQWSPEWRVPQTPHDAAKRERSDSFAAWPVDLVISDSNASDSPGQPVAFQLASSETETAYIIRKQFDDMHLLRTDIFTETQDDELVLDDHTIHQAVYELSPLKLMDMAPDAISSAFQVFRRANLKAGEGQYFTPRRVIESAVRVMEITRQDKLVDPACGTGGFLIEAYRSVAARSTGPTAQANARTFAHKQIWGADRDSINVKLARAIMVILGDGSANIHVGDTLAEHRWKDDYPHLQQPMKDDSYTAVITNPPFGQRLKVSAADARRNKYTIANAAAGGGQGRYVTLEVGLIFLERGYRLLVTGGKLGIVLPETYFFSPAYRWLPKWLEGRLELRGVLNIPMEAFQGFCRACQVPAALAPAQPRSRRAISSGLRGNLPGARPRLRSSGAHTHAPPSRASRRAAPTCSGPSAPRSGFVAIMFIDTVPHTWLSHAR